jgi:hypothetical protein
VTNISQETARFLARGKSVGDQCSIEPIKYSPGICCSHHAAHCFVKSW